MWGGLSVLLFLLATLHLSLSSSHFCFQKNGDQNETGEGERCDREWRKERAVGVKYKAFQDRNMSGRLSMTKSEWNWKVYGRKINTHKGS